MAILIFGGRRTAPHDEEVARAPKDQPGSPATAKGRARELPFNFSHLMHVLS